ncbi:hypothetical protein GCM10023084_05720 [Streptomyces lacrimifluminis]|uniref:Uncharacterized protein n=1 Tax=Streptomyces lacrimifluminis TaxID=1500077 RepID=A0A917KQR1_9ACTN|nr:hypothetical protein GCM10012282_19460 [Streptomyces lacrimifluminis]
MGERCQAGWCGAGDCPTDAGALAPHRSSGPVPPPDRRAGPLRRVAYTADYRIVDWIRRYRDRD